MDASNIMFLGLGSVALFGGVSMLMSKFVSFKKGRLSILEEQHEQMTNDTIEQINTATAKQNELNKTVQQTEEIAQEKREKVKQIIDNANKQIKDTLNETDLKKLDKQIQHDWSEL